MRCSTADGLPIRSLRRIAAAPRRTAWTAAQAHALLGAATGRDRPRAGTALGIGTVTEVGGRPQFTPFPKSAGGRRTVPVPYWLVPIIREHRARWPSGSGEPTGPITDEGLVGYSLRSL